jgi:hypothetical protein
VGGGRLLLLCFPCAQISFIQGQAVRKQQQQQQQLLLQTEGGERWSSSSSSSVPRTITCHFVEDGQLELVVSSAGVAKCA